MSYILDALRKSDQQRQRGAAPTLLMGQVAAPAPKQPAYLAYGLLAAVLLAAGIVIGWLRPWQAEQTPPAPVVAAPKPAVAQVEVLAVPAPPAPPAPPAHIAPAPAPAPARPPASPAAASAAPARAPAVSPAPPSAPAATTVRAPTPPAPAPAVAPAAAPAATPAPASTPAPVAPVAVAAPTAAPAAPAQNVIWVGDLPLAIQQELPLMTISVHAYSARPADRMVGINNRMLREGDSVAPGLKLEQITPEGMVFGYRGYSFRRGVK